jgi:ribosomal protein S27AE
VARNLIRMAGFKNFIMRGNLVELATRDCPECTMSVPVAARRCPECTVQIAPATEQPQMIS